MIEGFKLVVQPEELRRVFDARIKESEEKLAEAEAQQGEARTVSDRLPRSDDIAYLEKKIERLKYLVKHLPGSAMDYLLTPDELAELGLIPR